MGEVEKAARKDARDALGRSYATRLLAAFAVLVDGEGLLQKYGCTSSAHNEVCCAFRELREAGNIDF